MEPIRFDALDPEQLLAHDAFVRRLASQLLMAGGAAARSRAEDVAQQAVESRSHC